MPLGIKCFNLGIFWLKGKSEYSELTTEASKCLIPFTTSHLCELTFSSMALMKSKERKRVNFENDLILTVAKTDSRWQKVVCEKQAHT